ncbi:MAG: hypothetical protein HUJ26_01890 [Planctomycetaceae bacterium]|nr:hypothetical protein [Planctomycetaceae bacterium]
MSLSLNTGLIIVIGLLSVTAVTALVLMVMMLQGRKAVAHATGLSFVVSVLAHLGFVCGWFAWYLYSELNPSASAAVISELPPQEVVEIQEILDASEDQIAAEENGDSRLTDITENTTVPELDRFVPEMDQEPFPPLEPERNEVLAEATPPIDIPDVRSELDLPVSVPKPEKAGATGPFTQSQIPLEVEVPERQSRPEVTIPDTPLERTATPTVAQQDSPLERSQKQGAVNRIDIESNPLLSAPDLVEDPQAMLEKSDDTSTLSQMTGPTPTVIDDSNAGTESLANSEDGRVSDSPEEKITRTKLAEPIGIDGGSMQRERPNFAPSTPIPEMSGVEVTPSVPDLDLPALGTNAPNIVKPSFDLPLEPTVESVPNTYRLRSIERRADIARKFGGTDETERAVENSLAWLAAHQNDAGYWDADRYGSGQGPQADVADLNLSEDRKKVRRESGVQADTGVTALSLLAFLAAGYTNEEGQYAENVNRAMVWLVEQQREDGFLGGDATYFAANYCHGMATYALAEALGMQSNPEASTKLKRAVENGVSYTILMQNTTDGGWRYRPRSSEGDMSLFGWQLMALKSAEIAGVNIPETARERMISFLRDRSLGDNKGLAAYRPGEAITSAMTAEALFCKQILGIRRKNPQSTEAVRYLLRETPKISNWNLYYWYYGTLAMYQYGGEEWDRWNLAMRDTIVSTQKTKGDLAGSWDPVGPWGPYGGRVYSTALATLCLEVYYRFLPLYEHGSRFDE